MADGVLAMVILPAALERDGLGVEQNRAQFLNLRIKAVQDLCCLDSERDVENRPTDVSPLNNQPTPWRRCPATRVQSSAARPR